MPSLFREIARLLRSHFIAFFLFVVLTFFLAQYKPSRMVFAIFLVISTMGLVAIHFVLRSALLARHKRGVGVRRVLVVGTGELGREVAAKIRRHRELGLDVAGFLADDEVPPAESDVGPVLGTTDDIASVLKSERIDAVFVALPLGAVDRLRKVLEVVEEELVDVKVVPDLYQYVTLRAGVEEFEGLPIISLKDTPLYGWSVVGKRVFDVFASAAGLVMLSPVLGAIAAGVKLTSRGPVFYGQERMGLDGQVFRMLKFRSMRVDAEAQTGAVWASTDDPRRTAFGTFLRRTSLDELPQLSTCSPGT
ncbi:MAG: sugar transferase [Deltaproteobacteria bacterium]|nr:sugar transferase [Deltaproteobacteria bacterium]